MSHILTTTPPKHIGERRLYDQICGQESKSMYFWFALEFIPGVSDIDLLVWSKKAGVFVIEVKAIPIDALMRFSFARCEISGRNETKSPQLQAYDAMLSLRNFLAPKIDQLPFMVATVAWPLISREDWKTKFRGNEDIADLADKMIMSDDLNGPLEAVENRLRLIWKCPPIRKGGDKEFNHENDTFLKFQKSLNPEATPLATRTDDQRLEAFENSVRREILRSFPLNSGRCAIFEGYPGTGKTFRLLQIAIMHAREGGKVLLTCFNQVLASELQRLINLLDIRIQNEIGEAILKTNINAIDITTFAKKVLDEKNLSLDVHNYDEWGKLIVAELEADNYLIDVEKYDTVLIDEVQDFAEWHLSLLDFYLKEHSTIIYGYGANQELYGDSRLSLPFEKVRSNLQCKTIKLRRNFRNLKPIYLLAALFLECAPNSSKILDTFKRQFSNKSKGGSEIDFELHSASFPALTYVDDNLDHDFTDPTFYARRKQLLITRFKSLVERELDELQKTGDYRDLLILVPSVTSEDTKILQEVLPMVERERAVGFLDLVEKTHRKFIAPSDKIRLVTYHSCRGLEASRVLVFGIEGVCDLAKHVKTTPGRLGYIVLSRAIFSMTICLRSSKRNEVTMFLEKCLLHLNEQYSDTL